MRDSLRKAQLKRMVEDTDTWQGRAFDHVVKGLILFSVITYSIETLPNLSDRTQHFLYALEVVVVIIFTAEYVLRLYVADRKLAYVFSPLGIIDLLAILPFYLLLGGADSRAVRAMRLLRIARTLKTDPVQPGGRPAAARRGHRQRRNRPVLLAHDYFHST